MRILINAFSARNGGGKTYLVNLLSRLPDEGVLIYLYAHDYLDVPDDQRIIKLKVRFPMENPLPRLFWEKFFLPGILRRLKVDVLFCPGGVVNTKPPSGCRIVTMFRNMLPFDQTVLLGAPSMKLKLRNFLLRRSMLASMERADLVIFISEYARKIIQREISLKTVVTIPHGISEHFCVADVPLQRPALPFDEKYILYVSRFEFYKRHLEVVKAYAQLPDKLRDDYKLLIVGGDDLPSAVKVKDFIAEHGLGLNVVLLGDYPYKKLPSLYKNSTIFVFASACENCPNILLEAMGAGVPVICSDYDPMPEFGEDALLYASPDDPDIFSSQMASLLTSPELLAKYSAKVSARADVFKWSTTSTATWDAILGLR